MIALFFPARRAMLCGNCDACFEVTRQCPACGSDHIMPFGATPPPVRTSRVGTRATDTERGAPNLTCEDIDLEDCA